MLKMMLFAIVLLMITSANCQGLYPLILLFFYKIPIIEIPRATGSTAGNDFVFAYFTNPVIPTNLYILVSNANSQPATIYVSSNFASFNGFQQVVPAGTVQKVRIL
jgi:hypothetical protein